MKHFCSLFLLFAALMLLGMNSFGLSLTRVKGYTIQYSIQGIDEKPKANIENAFNEEIREFGSEISAREIQKFAKSSKDTIKKAIEPFGYFRAQIRTEMSQFGQDFYLNVFIIPGPRLPITKVHVDVIGEGASLPEFRKLVHENPIHPGDYLDINLYQQYKTSFFDTAEPNGFIRGKFIRQLILIDLKKYTAEIELIFDTGPRFYFGPITFNKNPYDDRFLARFAPFKPGDPYDADKIFTFQSNLGGAVYFQNVHVIPDVRENRYLVPVAVSVIPKKQHQYSFGLGYGTDTGVRGTVGFEMRQVNPEGHYVQGLVQLSQQFRKGSAAKIQYVIPGENPVTERYTLFAGALKNEINYLRYTSYQIGASQVKDVGDWSRITSIAYQYENGDNGSFNTLLPSISFEKVSTKNRIHVDNGYRIYWMGQAGVQGSVRDSFLQTELQGKWIFSPTDYNRFLLRGDVGTTAIIDENELPLSQSFAAGGAQSIRGYGYNSLGPGSKLIVLSAEFQQKVYKDFYAAVFYDAGNAFTDWPVDLQQGVGVGVVYRSPVGPLELTIAKAIEIPNWNYGDGLRLQFAMGTDL